jgi:NADPH-ferrihemoprotein reductase
MFVGKSKCSDSYRDARNMAKDVQKILVDIFVKFEKISEDEAHQRLKSLKTQGRYQEDVWS